MDLTHRQTATVIENWKQELEFLRDLRVKETVHETKAYVWPFSGIWNNMSMNEVKTKKLEIRIFIKRIFKMSHTYHTLTH